MKHIIIINGVGGCGKDTLINSLGLDGIVNFSSIDIIRDIIQCANDNDLLNIDLNNKTVSLRKLLSALKSDFSEYNDLPFLNTIGNIEEFINSDNKYMFIHIREPLEITKVKDYIVCNFGDKITVTTLLVKRETVGFNPHYNNLSDMSVYLYDYDIEFINSDLNESISRFKDIILSLQGV